MDELSSSTIKQNVKINKPHLWSLEYPYLYKIVVNVYFEGKLIDKVLKRYGIRKIEIKPEGFFLNGKHIKIKGTKSHQDHAGVGSALPDYLQYYRVRLLKDMGCNSIRTSHNPPTPELLDACDSLGMLVMDETRLLNSGSEYLSQFERLLKRDRSRTCVYIWSNGNKEGWVQTTGRGKIIAEKMIADGKDATIINVVAIDNKNREVPDADNLITFSVEGDAKIIGVGNGDPSSHEPDKCEDGNWQRHLFNGKCQLILQSGKTQGKVIVRVKSEGCWDNSAEIFTIQNQNPANGSVCVEKDENNKYEIEPIIGADISFLPELESKGIHFSDKEILKDHGFNYIRLRIFYDPAGEKGYSPDKGFCDLNHTLQMAKRIKNTGMKLLLDFHYSDYWADPGKQYKPAAWEGIDGKILCDSVYNYSSGVIQALKSQGTTPDMVQIGNEINHGMLWPDGHINDLNGLADLFIAGEKGVLSVDPSIPIMLHIALGGQNDESVFFVDNMLKRGVEFDVLGLSYYPQWHGTIDDLRNNLIDLKKRYNKDLVVVEYSSKKREVNDIIFSLPDNKGKGSFIWEPLSTWEYIFEQDGKSNDLIDIYDEIKMKYLMN